LTSLVLTALVAAPAFAQHGPGAGPPAFEEFDLDGDGRIVETEFYEARGRRIAERASEGRAMKHLSEAPSFAEIDTDGSGGIEPAEFSRHQADHRSSNDSN
jgi:Ca2+-binding EF-hand superfamily protein